MRQGPNGRRGPRRPHSGSNNGGHSGSGHSGSGHSGGHQGNRGGEPQRRTAASLRNQSFDSNGPDVRVRGNAWQVHEKYQSLARDAQMAGDRVAAENLLQHAEHYYRIIEAINEATAAEQAARGYQPNQQPDARGLYPAAPAPNGNGPGFAPVSGEAQVQSSQQAQTTASQQASPFFTPEESEAETEAQPARVASF